MITKAHVLAEVVRTAKTNGGVPLGRQRFYTETGIKEIDWIGKYWARWGDATRAVGVYPFRLDPFLPFFGRAPTFWAAFSEISACFALMRPDTASSKARR